MSLVGRTGEGAHLVEGTVRLRLYRTLGVDLGEGPDLSQSAAAGRDCGLDGSQGTGRLSYYGFPVSSAAHHHPTYEPKTITTGKYSLWDGAVGGPEVHERQLAQVLTRSVVSTPSVPPPSVKWVR